MKMNKIYLLVLSLFTINSSYSIEKNLELNINDIQKVDVKEFKQEINKKISDEPLNKIVNEENNLLVKDFSEQKVSSSSTDKNKPIQDPKELKLKGDATFKEGLAFFREKGFGGNELAFEKFLDAVDLGSVEAMTYTGYMLEKGLFLDSDIDVAMEFYKKASAAGDINAQYRLGLIQLNFGDSEEQNIGISILEQVGNKGHHHAALRVTSLLEQDPTPSNRNKALALYQKNVASGNSFIENNLALYYLNGFGVIKDEEKAKELFERSAKKHNIYAFDNLINLNIKQGRYLDAYKWIYLLDLLGKETKQEHWRTLDAHLNGNQKEEAKQLAYDWLSFKDHGDFITIELDDSLK